MIDWYVLQDAIFFNKNMCKNRCSNGANVLIAPGTHSLGQTDRMTDRYLDH